MSGSIGNSAVFLTDTPKQVQCHGCAQSANDKNLSCVHVICLTVCMMSPVSIALLNYRCC